MVSPAGILLGAAPQELRPWTTMPRHDCRQSWLSWRAVEHAMTKRTYIKIGVVAAIILGFAGLAAYQFAGGSKFSSNISEVKAQFNRDKGKVRLVVLLSPT